MLEIRRLSKSPICRPDYVGARWVCVGWFGATWVCVGLVGAGWGKG